MRVLVAHNYHLADDPHAIAEGKPYPPLGTAVVAAAVRANGHQVSFHDATFEQGTDGFAQLLDREKPERALIVADHHSVPQKMCLQAQRRSGFAMIAACRERAIPVLVAGPDVTDRTAEWLNAGADAAIRGEPDAGALAWLDGGEVAGLQTDPDVTAEPAPPIRDLAKLPSPAWDLVDLQRYRAAWIGRHGYWEAPVSSARGCPYKCNWCAKPIWGRSFQLRPAAAVVADCKVLADAGADRIWFTDDIFALKRPWLAQFRAEAERVGGIPPFRCLSRADLLSRPGAVDDLAAAGCVEVWMGAESGSQRVLDAMDKEQDVGEIHSASAALRAAGVRVALFLQLGYPGETIADVRATMAMVRSIRPDEIGISVSYPLPGTPFFERVRERMHATNWETAMDCTLLFQGEYEQAFYDAARDILHSEHRAIRGVLAAKRLFKGIRGPEGRRRDLKRVAGIPVALSRLPWLHRRLAAEADRHGV